MTLPTPITSSADVFEKAIATIRQGGVEAWFEQLPAMDAMVGEGYTISTDILDVWFDSGVTHHSVLKQEGIRQADLYLEGSDQHRGWFQSSLLTHVAMEGSAPYRQVLTHGFVVDESGRKMSKSLGNVVAPQTVLKTYGADILRLWVAQNAVGEISEMKLSDNILKEMAESYKKMRNTLRYLHSCLDDFTPETDMVPFDQLLLIDRWLLVRLQRATKVAVSQGHQRYRFNQVAHEVSWLFVSLLSNFYLDVGKDRVYTGAATGHARRSAQTAMYAVLVQATALLHPLIPFTTEELWKIIAPTHPALKAIPTLTQANFDLLEQTLNYKITLDQPFFKPFFKDNIPEYINDIDPDIWQQHGWYDTWTMEHPIPEWQSYHPPQPAHQLLPRPHNPQKARRPVI